MGTSSKVMVAFTGVWWYIATYTFMLKEYNWTAYLLFLIGLVYFLTFLLEKYYEQQRLLEEETEEREQYWSDR